MLKRTTILSLALLVPSVHAMVSWQDSTYDVVTKNKYFIIGGTVAAGVIGGIGYFIYSNEKKLVSLEKLIDELENKKKDQGFFPDYSPPEELCIDIVPESIRMIGQMLVDQKKYSDKGAEFPKGILLVGVPGIGKTTIAHILSNQSERLLFVKQTVEWKYLNDTDKEVGAWLKRIHKQSAEKDKGVVILLEDIDRLGEDKEVSNKLRNVMHDRELQDYVWLATATCPKKIDPLLLSSDYFSTIIEVPLPDKGERKRIISWIIKQKSWDSGVFNRDWVSGFAEQTEGCAIADLQWIFNHALLLATFKTENFSRLHLGDALNSYNKMQKIKRKNFLKKKKYKKKEKKEKYILL